MAKEKMTMPELRTQRDEACKGRGLEYGVEFAKDSKQMKELVKKFLGLASEKSQAKLPFSFDPKSRHMFYLVFSSLVDVFKSIDPDNLNDLTNIDNDFIINLVKLDKNSYLMLFWKWMCTVREKAEYSFCGLATLDECESVICGNDVVLTLAMTYFKDFCEILICQLANINDCEFGKTKLVIKHGRFATILNCMALGATNPDTVKTIVELCLVCSVAKPIATKKTIKK